MGSLSTSCPRCSTSNEVDTDILPRGASLISCWHCATQISISQQAVAEATKQPSPAGIDRKEVSATRSSSSSLPAVKERVSSESSGGALKIVAIGVGVLIVLLIGFGIVFALFSGSSESAPSAGQFRGAYHSGSERPSGNKAWQTNIAHESGFSPAVKGEVVFVVANELRSWEAKTYQPEGVPAEIIEELRETHAKMLIAGFDLEKAPQTTALQEDQSERFTINLLKGACYEFNVIGGAKAQDIDLLLYESDGVRLIIADTLGSGNASLEHCPTTTGNFVYELRMHKGKGLVSHVIYRELETTFHNKGFVYALNLNDGRQQWEISLDDEISSSPSLGKQSVLFGTRTRRRSPSTRRIVEGGSLKVVSSSDGASVCSYETVGPVISTPTILDGMAYFGSCGTPTPGRAVDDVCDPRVSTSSKLYALNVETCTVLWSIDAVHPIIEAPAAVADGVFFTSGDNVIAVDRLEGTKRWSIDAHGSTSGPVADQGLVVLGAQDGSLRALDASTGELRWVFESDAPMLAAPAIVESVVYAGSRDGNLYAVDMTTGDKQWDYGVGTPLHAAVGAFAGLVFTTVQNQLVVVDAESGSSAFNFQIEAGAGPRCSPILANGTLVFADSGGTVFGVR